MPFAFLLSVLLLALATAPGSHTSFDTAHADLHQSGDAAIRAVDSALQQPAAPERLAKPFRAPPTGGARDRQEIAQAVLWASARAVRTASARAIRMDLRAAPAVAVVALLFPFHFFW